MQPAANIVDIAFKRHADELRASWQARLLSGSLVIEAGFARPKNILGAAVLSVLAHNFDDAMPVLLRVALPGFASIGTPFLCSAAKVARTGQVMADIVTKDGRRMKNQCLFGNERAMEKAFRKLADELKFDDRERVEMFDAVKRWVVCDFRLDPALDPRDPDAKRLVH